MVMVVAVLTDLRWQVGIINENIGPCDYAAMPQEFMRIMSVEIHEETAELRASTATVIHTIGTTNIEHIILREHVESWDNWSGS